MSHTGSPDPAGATAPEPAGGTTRDARLAATAAYSPEEWRLLIRLPGRVIVAASSTSPRNPARTVAEGLAGLDGIAAGRAFDSELVRAVVAAIYAESDDGHSAPVRAHHADGGLRELLRSCRTVVATLARHADPADSAAYRQWVQSVAARVCRAAGPDGRPRPFGDPVEPEQRELLDRLGEALGLRPTG
ncbi:hypothetical protein [Plantactinospora sonchi]|uniref:Uncharacterized protein n=1 Tax=Plantactinospora sonchi TaxID=1544735 RepID=A0ABU7RSI8_9ACTN